MAKYGEANKSILTMFVYKSAPKFSVALSNVLTTKDLRLKLCQITFSFREFSISVVSIWLQFPRTGKWREIQIWQLKYKCGFVEVDDIRNNLFFTFLSEIHSIVSYTCFLSRDVVPSTKSQSVMKKFQWWKYFWGRDNVHFWEKRLRFCPLGPVSFCGLRICWSFLFTNWALFFRGFVFTGYCVLWGYVHWVFVYGDFALCGYVRYCPVSFPFS